MKVLLYTEFEKLIGNSGLGKAINHQMKALEYMGIEYTRNEKDDYDIIHINTYGPKAYKLAKNASKFGKKVVYHAHSTEEDFRNSILLSNQIAPLFRKWIVKCYILGDYIVTPTPYSKKLLEGYGITKPIAAISNGIDLEFFKKDEKLGKEFRKKYNFTKNDKVIIGIGLYIKRKGIIDFVELAKRLPEYKFIWFGHSALWRVPKQVKKACKTKLDNLIWAGFVEKDIIKGAMSGADLYLFPTLEETEGIPILEALATNQTTLIRDIPVFSEWLEDGKNIYKAKDIYEFEVKIKDILSGKMKDLSAEGYKVAEERDLRKIGEKLKKIYETVLDK